MSTFQCPSCGGTIDYSNSSEEMKCPFCGTDITTPGVDSNATIITPKVEKVEVEEAPDPASSAKTVIQQSKFKNSAEIMDEVKRSLREDDKEAAVRIYSKEFNVPLADARSSVDQIEIDMKHSGKEAAKPAPEPEPIPAPAPTPEPAYQVPVSDVIDSTSSAQPPNNTTRNWIIGCSIAFVLFCCFCVILPSVVSFGSSFLNTR